MDCDFPGCKFDALYIAVCDESKYQLCSEHLEFEDELGRKIFKDHCKQLISLGIPA